MRILVTGAAGFIGFHLTRRLLAERHEVLGYDGMTDYYDVGLKRDRLAQLAGNGNFQFVEAMLEDAQRLHSTVADFAPEIVVHLAAQAGVRHSLEHPEAYVSANVQGTLNLLEALRDVAPRHLVMASSSSIYGANPGLPFKETDRTDFPVSPYAATKKAAEALAHSHAYLYRIPTTCFRFFTVYGPWGRPDMALFKFARAIEAGEPIDVFGEGRMRRDFTYVDDLVEAICRLMPLGPETGKRVVESDSISPVAPWRAVNIAQGEPVGLLPFIEAVETALGRKAIKNMRPMQPGDVTDTWADPALLHGLTGYTPSTDIGTGVAAFVAWYREWSRR